MQVARTHLIRPPELPFFLAKRLVVLFGDEMAALEDHQAAVVVAVRKEIDEALDASESRAFGVLILMRPRLELFVLLVEPAGERDVDGVEGDEQVVGVEDLLEGADDARFGANAPRKALRTVK